MRLKGMGFDIALIGGTGIGDRLISMSTESVHIPTQEGLLAGRVLVHGDRRVLLVQRHSLGHKTPPHRVNYRAMALGLKAVGIRSCLATAAVGSLREDWTSGTRVICSGFIDVTGRNVTLFDRMVKHTDFSLPMGDAARHLLHDIDPDAKEGVYICANGPRYETPEEIRYYQSIGGDVVGMTAASEAVVMREAGIDYSCMAIVSNLACGLSDAKLAHGDVTHEMSHWGGKVVEILLEAVGRIGQ
jgi:5'-methylthioadenosine phosphorylase